METLLLLGLVAVVGYWSYRNGKRIGSRLAYRVGRRRGRRLDSKRRLRGR